MIMITVKEFKEWLEQFPEDTEVNVTIKQRADGPIRFLPPELKAASDTYGIGDGWEYLGNVLYIGEAH